jgi:hypothetical protein
MAHGGERVPSKPAAVSGPGRFSARTDGGPGGSGNANLVAPGGDYGSRQQLEAQQSAAPVPVGGTVPQAPPSQAPQGGGGGGGGGVFGPTQIPSQPITAGMAPQGMTDPLLDPQMIFRVLAQKWPSAYILGLLDE